MNWTPATSIDPRDANPLTMCSLGYDRESNGLRSHRECSACLNLVGGLPIKDFLFGSVHLLSWCSTSINPCFSVVAQRFCRNRRDSRAQFPNQKTAIFAQFWCSINPLRINTCKSVSKQTTSTLFGINTYEKHRGVGAPDSRTRHSPRRNAQAFSFQTLTHSFARFCTFLRSPKTQPFSFQAIPHSLPKNARLRNGGLAC